ncbi:hypothetical protein [Enemella sp. A6]|uniref:hypothetical protein n=1 Tax=Enemella sp. A6 TaxID=3440152 RepID=UPI003EBF0CA3
MNRNLSRLSAVLVGIVLTVTRPVPRDERGLSQSTENAILLAGAVTVAGIVVAAISVYVQSRLPK